MFNNTMTADIERVEQEVLKNQEVQSKISEKLEKAELKQGIGIELDIDNADLTKVKQQQDTMDMNIAKLISNLDGVTREFGSQFDEMTEQSTMEKITGWFSKSKAVEMRSDRIAESSIDSKLQEFVSQSNRIVTILTGQLENQNREYDMSIASLERISVLRQEKVQELSDVREEIEKMNPELYELSDKIASETDATVRTSLETELQEKNVIYNELTEKEKIFLAESQSFERYIETYEIFANSLQSQKSNQEVLINKLKIDTDERVKIYQATIESLKTAAQQDVAHKINDMGSAIDTTVSTTMAYIGAASDARTAETLEAHEGHMLDLKEISKASKRAADAFDRRFGQVMDKHEKANYSKQD